ncbi:MAG: M48 family metalloprotease, partial [Candidatus Omnitrophica bacterium]|nr:M48 family metalloprotease [Candidatus Omnitrophota bacterium]
RSFEAEADKLGAFYMHKAGFEPQAMIEVFETFLKLQKEKKEKQNLGIFASHPSLEWRIKRIKEIIPQIKQGVPYEEIK